MNFELLQNFAEWIVNYWKVELKTFSAIMFRSIANNRQLSAKLNYAIKYLQHHQTTTQNQQKEQLFDNKIEPTNLDHDFFFPTIIV